MSKSVEIGSVELSGFLNIDDLQSIKYPAKIVFASAAPRPLVHNELGMDIEAFGQFEGKAPSFAELHRFASNLQAIAGLNGYKRIGTLTVETGADDITQFPADSTPDSAPETASVADDAADDESVETEPAEKPASKRGRTAKQKSEE